MKYFAILLTNAMDKLTQKICKHCGTPCDYVNEYIEDASTASDIFRMKEYVRCVKNVERRYFFYVLKNKISEFLFYIRNYRKNKNFRIAVREAKKRLNN